MSTYRHTQIGYVVLALLGVAVAVLVTLMIVIAANAVGIGVGIVLVLALVLFGWLTVEIGDDRFAVRFGIGLIRRSIPLSDIESCVTTRIPWYHGWGIRYTTQGWLYRTSGLMAVKLTLKSGKAILIGTDDVEALCSAVNDATRSTKRR